MLSLCAACAGGAPPAAVVVASAAVDASAPSGRVIDAGPRSDPVADLVRGGLAAGGASACAITDDGHGRVVCWGDNQRGQLGIGHPSGMEAPRVVDGLEHVVELASSGQHVCARTSTRDVLCWGWLDADRGKGPPTVRPARVDGLPPARAIDAAGHHTCALSQDGRVACWGEGTNGVLGEHVEGYRAAPVEVRWSSPFEGVATGFDETCAWDRDGQVVCWGAIPVQVGLAHGFRPDSPPQVVRSVPGIVRAVVGDGYICAIDRDGRAGCWGVDAATSRLPRFDRDGGAPPAIDDAVDLAARGDVVCFLRRSGSVSCAGFGAAGDEQTAVRDPRGLAVGYEFACAREGGQGIACWGGKNDKGQLGDGTLVAHAEARLIAPAGATQARLAGDACDDASDCAFDRPCAPTRCVRSAWVDPSSPVCSSPSLSIGSCACIGGRCMLHAASAPQGPACTSECALDEGAGRCTAGAPAGLATPLDEGPVCRCDEGTRQCRYEWVDRVSCNSVSDCEISVDPPSRIVGKGKGRPPALTRTRCGGLAGTPLACIDHVCRRGPRPPPRCE
jgi:hypothetical protein